MTDWAALYQDLHRHPELAYEEERTAGVVARTLRGIGFEVIEGVGGTGVVGVLQRGSGPRVLLRADMDALPVREETGLPYASQVSEDPGPVMHACGHDVHVTCLLAAAAALALEGARWHGTVVVVFQPAEEAGTGARAMVDDGLYERVGLPDVVLGQHVTPMPAGVLGLHPGVAFAASDRLRVRMIGRGGHASRPHAAVDPVVMAAAAVLRLQSVVSREVAPDDSAVVTVGSLHAGSAGNVIPDEAEMQISIRSFDTAVRARVLAAVERIVRAEAAASGAPDPEVVLAQNHPAVVNDAEAAAATRSAFAAAQPPIPVVDPGATSGSEDVGILATAANAPCVYWLLGGADPAHFAGVTDLAEARAVVDSLPGNHSPLFAPVPSPTLEVGSRALVVAARHWLAL